MKQAKFIFLREILYFLHPASVDKFFFPEHLMKIDTYLYWVSVKRFMIELEYNQGQLIGPLHLIY